MKILKNLVVVVCCIVLCGDVIFAAKRVRARAQIEPAVTAAAMSGLVLPSPRAVVPASYDDLPQRGPASDIPLSNGVVLREEDEAAVETDTEAVAHDEDAIYCFDCSDMQARCSCLIDCFVCQDRHEKT